MQITLTAEANVSSDGKRLVLAAVAHRHTLQRGIIRDTLEEH